MNGYGRLVCIMGVSPQRMVTKMWKVVVGGIFYVGGFVLIGVGGALTHGDPAKMNVLMAVGTGIMCIITGRILMDAV